MKTLHYFEWGNEPAGYVTTWKVAADGGIARGPEMRRCDLPPAAVHRTPGSYLEEKGEAWVGSLIARRKASLAKAGEQFS